MLVQTIPIKIESGNTDGINVIYNKKYVEDVKKIYHQWEHIVNAQLEITPYIKVIRTNVNNYMAIKPNGSVKYKGDFEINKELHKDMSMHIVRIAIDNYYRYGIPVTKTITECKDIYDFCKSIQIRGTIKGKWRGIYEYLEEGEKKVIEANKNIRYYIDDTGKRKLRKYCYSGESKGKYIDVESKQSVTMFNQFIDLPFNEYKVKQQYYIAEAYKIIHSVSIGQLTLF
jgi:hypothetical protein